MPLIDAPQTKSNPENCRTCVDFKSWAKQQRKSLTTSEVNLIKIVKFTCSKMIFLEKRCKKGSRA